jgi:prepilin-type N-terminal cleavage/methylation domain-containing protein
MYVFKKNTKRGFALLEVVIAVSIIVIAFVVLITVYNLYLNKAKSNLNTVKAVYLSEEGIEAVKLLRNASWTTNIASLSQGTDYFLTFGTNSVQINTTNTFIDGLYERKINFSNVYRDSNSDITASGGTIDTGTKLVTVTTSWSEKGATTTKSLSTYITNLYSN